MKGDTKQGGGRTRERFTPSYRADPWRAAQDFRDLYREQVQGKALVPGCPVVEPRSAPGTQLTFSIFVLNK